MVESRRQPGDYDLEERTFAFAHQVRKMVKELPGSTANREDARQLIRASGSVGANYLEANNSLSKKDFRMRIRICLKEAKESGYWLRLLQAEGRTSSLRVRLIQESTELVKIFSTIYQRSQ